MNVPRLVRIRLDFLAQPPDRVVHGPGGGIVGVPPDFAQQFPAVGIEIVDDQGVVIARIGPASAGASRYVRAFPLLFSDWALMTHFSSAGTSVQVPQWQACVSVANDATRVAVTRGVARTLGLLALAGLVTIVGAAFTVRAARAADNLFALQSEFMASVTHEMNCQSRCRACSTSSTVARGRSRMGRAWV